jgi:hypothetical protein
MSHQKPQRSPAPAPEKPKPGYDPYTGPEPGQAPPQEEPGEAPPAEKPFEDDTKEK